MLFKHEFTASWSGPLRRRNPVYYVKSKRVSAEEGYQYARTHGIELSDKFHIWHNNNSKAGN